MGNANRGVGPLVMQMNQDGNLYSELLPQQA